MNSTFKTIIIDGMPVSVPNVIDDAPTGYYVSYNNYDLDIYGCDTTAIVIDRTSAFLILNGDHRDALKGLSLKDACAYFHANVNQKNFRSNDHEDDRLININGKWKIVRQSVSE